ncbi:MAG TPA: hypothetical protein VNO14_18515, partial [Blastocatellia bacterium]|nr:hypothetical protein [Blastocatellia bacterium]
VVGALRRIIKRERARDAWILGLGIAVLANSRPYEGLVLSLMAGAVLLAWMLKRGRAKAGASSRRILLPLIVSAALIALWTGFYNLRITGSPFRMPYLVHEQTYGIAPLFVFQDPRPEPDYNHKAIRDIHSTWELADYLSQQSLEGFLMACKHKLENLARWNLQDLAFMIPLAALPLAIRRDPWVRGALGACAIFVAALLVETWLLPHYASAIIGLTFVIIIQSMRRLSAWRWGKHRAGRHILRATLAMSAVYLIFTWANLPPVNRSTWSERRARMLEELKQTSGRHLVIVRYAHDHVWSEEWVYNEADIDAAQVVWAREMDEESNNALLEYFKDRRVWLLEVGAGWMSLKEMRPEMTAER